MVLEFFGSHLGGLGDTCSVLARGAGGQTSGTSSVPSRSSCKPAASCPDPRGQGFSGSLCCVPPLANPTRNVHLVGSWESIPGKYGKILIFWSQHSSSSVSLGGTKLWDPGTALELGGKEL